MPKLRILFRTLQCTRSPHVKHQDYTDLDRMQKQDPDFQSLRLSQEAANFLTSARWNDFLSALKTNLWLHRLEISGWFVSSLSRYQCSQFWCLIAELVDRQLVRLALSDFSEEAPLSVEVIAAIFGHSNGQNRKLVELDLQSVRIAGDPEYLREILVRAQQPQSKSPLQAMECWDVDFVRSGTRQLHNNPQDPQQPTNPSHNWNHPYLHFLSIILQLTNLQALSLGNFQLDQEHVMLIAQTLEQPNHGLKALRLRGGGKSDDGPPHRLRRRGMRHHPRAAVMADETTLENHHLTYGGGHLSPDSCAAMAHMLTVNKSLEALELCELEIPSSSTSLSSASSTKVPSGLVVFASALRHNTTLKAFHLFQLNFLWRHDMTSHEHEALVNMLKHNQVLESLTTGDAPSPEMEFYLKLNRAKLRRLMVDIHLDRHKLWELLASLDLDCRYHLLTENPSLLV